MKKAIIPILMLTIIFTGGTMLFSVRQSQPSGPELYTLNRDKLHVLFRHVQPGHRQPAGGHEIQERRAYGYPYRALTVDTVQNGDWYAKLALYWLATNSIIAGIVAWFLVISFRFVVRHLSHRLKASQATSFPFPNEFLLKKKL